jgi:hypothetical protein
MLREEIPHEGALRIKAHVCSQSPIADGECFRFSGHADFLPRIWGNVKWQDFGKCGF